MDSSGMWPGGSLALGIVVFLIGVLLILVSMPLAKGNVQASRYNYRPIQQYKLSNEERDRMGKPTALASMVVALLFILAGLASVAPGITGNACPSIMYLFLGTIIVSAVGLPAIIFVSLLLVKRAQE
jgi:hypothetical protein